MARLPFRIRLGRSQDAPLLAPDIDDDEPTEAEGTRRLLLQLALQSITIFMVVVALLYWAISALLGSGIFIPNTAGGVLSSASQPSYYAWSSESVRQATLAGVPMRQDVYRSAVVDPGLNKFQSLAVGVFQSPTIWLSDSHLTAYYTQAGQQAGQGWRLITNICQHAPTIPASYLEMPTPQEIEKGNPSIISTTGSVFGTQAWVISFHPTTTVLRKIFWIDFFNAVTADSPQNRRWVLSSTELAAINTGKIKLVYAYAWVTRSPRELRQIEMKFYTSNDKSSGYRFLVKLYPPEGRPLVPTSFGSTDCNSATTKTNSTNKGLPTVP